MTPAEIRLFNRAIDAFEQSERTRRFASYLAVPTAVFVAVFLLSALTVSRSEMPRSTISPAMVIPGGRMTAWEIFLHNVEVLLAILVGGTITLTLGAFLLLMINAAHFAAGVGFLVESYGRVTALASFVPHGAFEVTAFLVAASVALRISVLATAWKVPRREDIPSRAAAEIAALVAASVALLAIAAVVEARITPQLVHLFG